MLSWRDAAIAAATVGCVTVIGSNCAAQAIPRNRASSLHVVAQATGENSVLLEDVESSSTDPTGIDFGTFSHTITAEIGSASTATAVQTSTLDFDADGYLKEVSLLFLNTAVTQTTDAFRAHSSSAFTLFFDVTDIPVQYVLSGSVNSAGSGSANGNANLQMRDIAEQDPLIVLAELYTDSASGISGGSLPASGTLLPGRYYLNTGSSADVNYLMPNSASASLSLTLTFSSVPPPPPPPGPRWINDAGGSFGTAANWDPVQIPDHFDDAVFAGNGNVSYTVTLDQNRLVQSISVGEDRPDFDLNARTLSLDHNANGRSLLVGTAYAQTGRATFRNGTVSTAADVEVGAIALAKGILKIDDDARLIADFAGDGEIRVGTLPSSSGEFHVLSNGQAFASEVKVGSQGKVFIDRDVLIADTTIPAAGGSQLIAKRFSVRDGGDVTSGQAFIENGAVEMTDEGSSWTVLGYNGDEPLSASLVVGAQAVGAHLSVRNGAGLSADEFVVGLLGGSSGSAEFSGRGSTNKPASISVATAAIGVAGQANLSIAAGATVDAQRGSVAAEASSHADITVDGKDSLFAITGDELIIGRAGTASLTLTNRGRADASGAFVTFGQLPGSSGTLTIDGSSSNFYGGSIVIGGEGQGSATISNNGSLDGVDIRVGNVPGGAGLLTVTSSADIYAQSNITVGHASGNSTGLIRVSGASSTLGADTFISVLQGGTIELNDQAYLFTNTLAVDVGGVVQGNGGTISVDSVINNGTISPGLSPGTLTIYGNYQQGPSGVTLIEIGGTEWDDFDHLIINGASALDGTLTLRFINGFAPLQGHTFDVMDLLGAIAGSFSQVQIENLLPGFEFDAAVLASQGMLVALTDGTYIPEPGGAVCAAVGLLAMRRRRRAPAR